MPYFGPTHAVLIPKEIQIITIIEKLEKCPRCQEGKKLSSIKRHTKRSFDATKTCISTKSLHISGLVEKDKTKT